MISLEKQRNYYLRRYGLICKMSSYLTFCGEKECIAYSYTFNFNDSHTVITLNERKLTDGNVGINPITGWVQSAKVVALPLKTQKQVSYFGKHYISIRLNAN